MTAPAEQAELTLERAERAIRQELESMLEMERRDWMPAVELEGQLIRPLVSVAGMINGSLAAAGNRFWRAVLAVQLAHEASLLHDDIADGAATRRGRPTLSNRKGVAAALVRGDHLLSAAYRHSAATSSLPFVTRFARGVERTVAAEVQQAGRAGHRVNPAQYREMVLGKSGELLGVALSASATLEGRPEADELFELGRRVGLLYQMMDDLLDYCPSADTGKPPLADHKQRKWTWVLSELPADSMTWSEDWVLEQLRLKVGGSSPLDRCLATLQREKAELQMEVQRLIPGDRLLGQIVEQWLQRVTEAVIRESGFAAVGASECDQRLLAKSPGSADLTGYIARNSRSFRFASRFFPRQERQRIERLYAFCRVTDDIVDSDEQNTTAGRERLLDRWAELAESAYGGRLSGIAVLDSLMLETAEAGIPFRYAADLVEGVRMDLQRVHYSTFADLELYTYRVASVVGLWMTELSGRREPNVLKAAASLGRAMQLTNILRDVGEDLDRGRLYLPTEVLERHGLTAGDLRRMRRGEVAISDAYRALTESLLRRAEADYESAIPAIPHLPTTYRPPVMIAAYVYRGIHDRIRKNRYDNLRRRAYTTQLTKLGLSSRALCHNAFPRGWRKTPEGLVRPANTHHPHRKAEDYPSTILERIARLVLEQRDLPPGGRRALRTPLPPGDG